MRSARQGFTLIELLIVIVIVGILSAIAIPQFSSTKEKGYLAQMKMDLKNIVAVEEGYAVDNANAYIPAGTATSASPWHGIGATSGVTITIDAPGTTSYSATAVHTSVPGRVCGIYYGLAAAPAGNPATSPGTPECN
jgi:prepilin-type N-terminal cleavage/methylation domain-containing protein